MNNTLKTLFALLFSSLLICFFIYNQSYSRKVVPDMNPSMNTSDKNSIFIVDGQCIEPLATCLEIFSIEHDNTLATIVEKTQKAWLRKPGQERWHQEEIITSKTDELLDCFAKLSMLQEIKPTKKRYKYALLLGASITRVRTRLSYLLQLWQEGIRFETLVLLGGQRSLDPEIESEALLLDHWADNRWAKKEWSLNGTLPTSETEMLTMVLDQTELPKEFENVTIVLVDTPLQPINDGSGKMRRPITGDTINHWLLKNPEPGSCLAISNQPFIGYQHAVLKTALPSSFTLETVGDAAAEDIKIATLLDNLARWLYQESQRIAKTN